MITLTQTNDLGYISDVLKRPGMRSLCLGGCQRDVSVDDMVKDPKNTYLVVTEDGERRGFVSLTDMGAGVAIIHLALQTRRYKTLHCVLESLKMAGQLGFKSVYAIYPETRTSVRKIAELIGFKTVKEHVPLAGFSDLFISQAIQI